MPVLMEIPVSDPEGMFLLVEVDHADLPEGLVLASPTVGEVAARATRTLSESLAQLEPVLRTVKNQLTAASPDAFSVELGIKLGGETGLILAKGTAEVNLKITMSWNRSVHDAND
jgi:hypothetical protein